MPESSAASKFCGVSRLAERTAWLQGIAVTDPLLRLTECTARQQDIGSRPTQFSSFFFFSSLCTRCKQRDAAVKHRIVYAFTEEQKLCRRRLAISISENVKAQGGLKIQAISKMPFRTRWVLDSARSRCARETNYIAEKRNGIRGTYRAREIKISRFSYILKNLSAAVCHHAIIIQPNCRFRRYTQAFSRRSAMLTAIPLKGNKPCKSSLVLEIQRVCDLRSSIQTIDTAVASQGELLSVLESNIEVGSLESPQHRR